MSLTLSFRRGWAKGLLVATLAVVAICSLARGSADERQLLAKRAIFLMERSIEVGMPQEFPKHLRRKVPAHVVEDFYADHKNDKLAGFFEPEWIRSRDRKLHRELKRFWKTKEKDLLAMVPNLPDLYMLEERDIQRGIVRLVKALGQEIPPDTPGEAAIPEALLRILEVSEHREDRLRAIDNFGFRVAPTESYEMVMNLVEGRDRDDHEMRWHEIGVLRGVLDKATAPASLGDFLIAAAAATDDPCYGCRASAVGAEVIRKYGKDRVLPTYLKACEEAIDRSRAMLNVCHLAFASHDKHLEALPYFLKLLDAKDPRSRGIGILGLQQLTGLGVDRMGYEREWSIMRDAELDHNYRVRQAMQAGDTTALEIPAEFSVQALRAVQTMVDKWKRWWSAEGEEFLHQHGVNARAGH